MNKEDTIFTRINLEVLTFHSDIGCRRVWMNVPLTKKKKKRRRRIKPEPFLCIVAYDTVLCWRVMRLKVVTFTDKEVDCMWRCR